MADTTNLLAGTATLTVDGTAYMLEGELKYNVSKVTRETMKGMDGVHGYKETPNAGYISGRFRDTGSLTVAQFNAMTNVTVTAKLANGKTIIGRNMWTVETQEVDSAEAPLRCAGKA
ncbi:phage tail tube protein [Aquitalea magnusonii]|uniref:phage tail tube protein n=1 Tax=Aquitalea magnusonii TaxID=332411 RepID=UPI000A88FB3C|nr:phage tail tube protein [Aquitalea magnusonii]